ncbi:MAG: response regulator [Candidatus Riflebacteria bacterium]|nr:response regulator [Candidatus Riflebacteria bacterium]
MRETPMLSPTETELLSALPFPVAVKAAADRRYVLWNKAAEDFLGIPAGEIVGGTGETLFEAGAVDAWRAAEGKALAGAGPATARILGFPAPGGLVDFEIRVQVLNAGRTPCLFLLTFLPVRPLRELEEEVRRAREDLIAGFNEGRKAFALLNHQVRTSLSNITGMLGMLLDQDLATGQRELAETALVSAIAILNILNEAGASQKRVGRQLPLEAVEFDPGRLLEAVIEQHVETAFRKGLDLATVIQDDVPATVVGDPGCLRQVLQNLLQNAIKAMERGSIRIRLRVQAVRGDEVRLRFEWPGLPEEIARLVIEAGSGAPPRSPYLQLEGRVPSLDFLPGWHVAEILGGELALDGPPRRPPCLVFCCPFRKAPGSGMTRSPVEAVRHGTFLVAHPHDGTRHALAEQLETWGGAVLQATTPAQVQTFLEASAQRPQPPTAILLDTFWMGQPGLHLTEVAPGCHRLGGVPCLTILPWEMGDSYSHRPEGSGIPGLSRPILPSRLADRLARLFRTVEGPARGGQPHLEVLVVDDNRTNLRVACRILEKLGCRVTAVESGQAALETVARRPVDLVFLDCVMADPDGFETCRRLRAWEKEHGKRIPVIAISANAQPEDQSRSLAAGMDDFLAKPFRAADFQRVIDRWGGGPALAKTPAGPTIGPSDEAKAPSGKPKAGASKGPSGSAKDPFRRARQASGTAKRASGKPNRPSGPKKGASGMGKRSGAPAKRVATPPKGTGGSGRPRPQKMAPKPRVKGRKS